MQIFIINLQTAKIRKNKILKNIKNLKKISQEKYKDNQELLDFLQSLEFIFYPAVDAREREHLEYKKHFSPLRSIFKRAMRARDGELACYASHFKLWGECIKLNKNIVILEDDVEFSDNFLEGLYDISKQDYEYVRLHYIDYGEFKHLNTNFYYTTSNIASGAGYFLKPSAAKKFAKVKKWDLPVDLVMDAVYRHGVDNIVYLKDNQTLIKTKNLPTQIQDRNIKKRFLHKVLREIYRPFLKIRILIFKLFYKIPKSNNY